MRNIAEILEDDKNGKRLSQTERQIAVAYIQGKYDAVMELSDTVKKSKSGNNLNTNEVIDKIRAEIEDLDRFYDNDYFSTNNCPMYKCNEVLLIIDKYKAESEDKE